MPERNILLVDAEVVQPLDEFPFMQYYALIDAQTIHAFRLQGAENDDEFIVGNVNSIIGHDGQTLKVVNERMRFKTWRFLSKRSVKMFGVKLPDNLLRDYGVRIGEYIDVLFEEVTRGSKTEKIFPKMFRYGRVSLKFSMPQQKEPVLPEVLLNTQFDDPFYSNLVIEINETYGYGFYRSTLVLLRLLFESLLVDLLRARYGMSKVEMFFDKSHGRHHSLSALLDNIKENSADFKVYSDCFDELPAKIGMLKQKGDASAHIIDDNVSAEYFKQKKTDINYTCNLLKSVLDKVRSSKSG